MSTYFWYAAGLLSGVAAAFVIVPLARSLMQRFSRRARIISVALAVVAFAATALIVYRTLGHPDALEQSVATVSPAHPGARQPSPGEQAQSLESVATQLEERLMRESGSDGDWQLLAQTYEVMGRPDDASRVRAHAAAVGKTPAQPAVPATSTAATAELETKVAKTPRDASAWLELATLYRHQRQFDKSRAAFDRLIALKAMTADSWADYADVLATLAGGSLVGEPERAIDRALKLDAQHPKALWLKASLAHEQGRYRDSLAVWKQLRATLPATSPDVKIIDANIAEAKELAQSPAFPALTAPAQAQAQAVVSGTVSIDKALAAQVAPGATLFIYAKAADSPGPPLAVLRTSASSWPVSFRLDDTLAMMPARKLSDFNRVIVEARISRSGQATPAPGDLFTQSPVFTPAEGKELQLVISRVIS